MQALIAKAMMLVIYISALAFGCKYLVNYRPNPDLNRLVLEEKIDRKILRAAWKYGCPQLVAKGFHNDIMLRKVRGREYMFRSKENLTLDKGREILVKLVLDILKIYNEDRLYKKYLFEYPLTTKNIDVSVSSKIGEAKEHILPNIGGVWTIMNHLSFTHYSKISGKPKGRVDSFDPNYESYEIKESFRLALSKVANLLSNEQKATAESLSLLDGNLKDEEISSDTESQKEIKTKELWILAEEKNFKEGRNKSRNQLAEDIEDIKKSNTSRWERDTVFSDEKQKRLYDKKKAYLKGEKEWDN